MSNESAVFYGSIASTLMTRKGMMTGIRGQSGFGYSIQVIRSQRIIGSMEICRLLCKSGDCGVDGIHRNIRFSTALGIVPKELGNERHQSFDLDYIDTTGKYSIPIPPEPPDSSRSSAEVSVH